MRWAKRAALSILGLLVLAAIGLAIWEPLSISAAPAPPEKKYDATIARDTFGVPHINGKTDADASYGLAYAHAEDDFSTIQEVLAMTRGRYAAMVGGDGAKIDYVGAFLGSRETARREYPKMPADVRAVLDGYAAGLNRYAQKHPGEVRLSKLFPVNGEDVATGFVLRSPFFFGLDEYIGRLTEGKKPPVDSPGPITPIGRDPSMNGSNAFAMAPKKMADGKTWLISNSHQPYEGQVAWYEAVMHSDEGLDMAGALFPGSPFILLGHNKNLGWTNTVNHPDLVDVYKLVLNADGTQYRYDGKWLPLISKRIWLRLKYGPFTVPWPQTIYRSLHGPVIKNKSGAFAIRYAGIDQARNLEQYYRITKAQDWAQWTKAMDIGGVAATNFIYADKTGRIAYIYNAMFPPRKPGYNYQGVLPGDTSASMWTGTQSFAAMPKIVDPVSGFVTNANNTPFLSAGKGSEMDPADYSPLMGIERRLTNRGIRSVELMSADNSITPQEMLRIKFDTGYSKASYVGIWMAKIAALDLRKEPDLAKAQTLLATWDWKSDGKGGADTLAELMIRAANTANYHNKPLPDAQKELRKWVDHMMTHFKRIDVPLLEMQRLRRGKVDLPMDGGTDAIRATSMWDKDQPDGKGRVKHGDSFIMIATWDKAGTVSSRSIQPYGAATTRPESKHYTDQMQLFSDQKFKDVWFTREALKPHIVHEYRP
jgi:acyl-homoserine-lactone acylase